MSRPLAAARAALELTQQRARAALDEDRTPWTAVAQLTKQEAALLREVATLSAEEVEDAPLTPEDVRREILALPDDLVDAAAAAVRERKKGGRRLVE